MYEDLHIQVSLLLPFPHCKQTFKKWAIADLKQCLFKHLREEYTELELSTAQLPSYITPLENFLTFREQNILPPSGVSSSH